MTTKTNLATPAFNATSWNVPLNSNFTIVNNALGNTESVSASSGDVTLTSTQAQSMRIAVSGALGANRTLFFPAGTTGFWIVSNATSGAYTLTVKNTSGSAEVVVSQGTSAIVYSDGTNCGFADDGAGLPVGMIIQSAGTSAPNGYVVCDGAAYLRNSYSRLFAVIGTTWGAGDGSTTFNVPDLRGAFLRGSGAGLNPSSRSVGSYEADDVKPHTHTLTDPGHSHTLVSYNAGSVSGGGQNVPITAGNNSTFPTSTATTGITIANSTGVETRPKNYAVLYCIKY